MWQELFQDESGGSADFSAAKKGIRHLRHRAQSHLNPKSHLTSIFSKFRKYNSVIRLVDWGNPEILKFIEEFESDASKPGVIVNVGKVNQK